MSASRLLRFALPICGLLAWLATACEEPVDLDIELPPPRLVISCNFNPDQLVRVNVSKSDNVLSTAPSVAIADAEVEIYKDTVFLERLELVMPGGDEHPYYTTQQLRPQVGVQYQIRVVAPDFPPASATSSIPESVNISSLEIGDLQTETGHTAAHQYYTYNVAMNYDDPLDRVNYYHINFYQQVFEFILEGADTTYTREFLYPVAFEDGAVNNYVVAATTGGVLLQDKPFQDNLRFRLGIEVDPKYQKLGSIIAELRTVSQEYYLFHSSLSRQQQSGQGGLNEPVFVYNNVQNGHGIFAGYNLSAMSRSLY